MTSAKKCEYLVLADHRFGRMAEKELGKVFPGIVFEERKRYGDVRVTIAGIKKPGEEVASIMGERMPSFIDFVMPIDRKLRMIDKDFKDVSDAIAVLLRKYKGRSFRIEAKRIDTNLKEGAKSIEVLLGQRLEKQGFVADLKEPKLMIYVVFLKGGAMMGHSEISAGTKASTLDIFRAETKEETEPINRAEFKMKEAVGFFGIDLKKIKTALDIGAAPGGWTHYLSQQGIRVVAVDNALLDYKKIAEGKRVLVLAGKGELPGMRKTVGLKARITVADVDDSGTDLKAYDVIHIKANMQQDKGMDALRRFGRFDMLTIDTNTAPSESSDIACTLSVLMKRGAQLVMTTKLVTGAFDSHIKAVMDGLSRCYRSIRIKKLPRNRRELTVYALLKGRTGRRSKKKENA